MIWCYIVNPAQYEPPQKSCKNQPPTLCSRACAARQQFPKATQEDSEEEEAEGGGGGAKPADEPEAMALDAPAAFGGTSAVRACLRVEGEAVRVMLTPAEPGGGGAQAGSGNKDGSSEGAAPVRGMAALALPREGQQAAAASSDSDVDAEMQVGRGLRKDDSSLRNSAAAERVCVCVPGPGRHGSRAVLSWSVVCLQDSVTSVGERRQLGGWVADAAPSGAGAAGPDGGGDGERQRRSGRRAGCRGGCLLTGRLLWHLAQSPKCAVKHSCSRLSIRAVQLA